MAKIWRLNDGGIAGEGYTREQIADWLVESGSDCEAVLPEFAQEVEKPMEELVAK
jgi:hypothetical protein